MLSPETYQVLKSLLAKLRKSEETIQLKFQFAPDWDHVNRFKGELAMAQGYIAHLEDFVKENFEERDDD